MAGVRCPDWPDGCPYPDATDPNGEYFHLCCGNPLSHDGGAFLTAAERRVYEKKCPCQRNGISVFPSINRCLELKRKMSPAVSEKWTHVAVATLGPEHGWVKPTPGMVSEHTTWWPSHGLADRIALFAVAKVL